MADPALQSPTNSSLSSSDLDTESTGSFFHDSSTTLGNLMGVSVTPFQAITFRDSISSQFQSQNPASAAHGGRKNKKQKKIRMVNARQRRRRWWMFCREESNFRRASLGEYLEVERRFEVGGAMAELEERIIQDLPRNGRVLFADGRVLPPVEVAEESSPASGICRFPGVVSLGGICSRGAMV